MCVCHVHARRLNFGSAGALRHGGPSPDFAPLAAALAPSHTPLLLASRSTRDHVQGERSLALHAVSGYSVATMAAVDDGCVAGPVRAVAVAASSHYPTLAVTGIALTSGRWQYEVGCRGMHMFVLFVQAFLWHPRTTLCCDHVYALALSHSLTL